MGTSCWGCGSGSKGRDHPHAYGDKLSKSAPTVQSLGSSPRVWGQGYHSTAVGVSERIIPTRMGTSLLCQCPPLYIRDHPHAYGDKSGNVGFIALAQRSSPRVWGQEVSVGLGGTNYWIIPTRMGTSFMQVAIDFAYRDHPHVKSNMVYTLCKHMVYMLSITNEHKK